MKLFPVTLGTSDSSIDLGDLLSFSVTKLSSALCLFLSISIQNEKPQQREVFLIESSEPYDILQ